MLQRMDERTHQPTTRTQRARVAAAVCFFVQGFCFAALLTKVNVLKDRFGFSDGELSLVLLVVPVVAGLGSVLAGLFAARLGSALVLRAGGLRSPWALPGPESSTPGRSCSVRWRCWASGWAWSTRR